MKKFLAALFLAMAVSFGLWFSAKRDKERLETAYKTTTVLQARKYIASGKTLAPEMVEEKNIPAIYAPAGSIEKKSELLDPHGKPKFKLLLGLPKGETLTRSRLVDDAGAAGLAWTLEPGESAMSLRLNLEDAVAGLIKPGDWVAVLATFGGRTRTLLTRVRVAAVGDRVWNQASAPDTNELSKPMAGESILVTLILSPLESMQTRSAAAQGAVTLALSSPLDK